MCRWMGWLGQPILIEELLFKTQHGIVDQSLHARMGAEPTNGDGFGLGWYGDGDGPGVYHNVAPAWGDANLPPARRPYRIAPVPRARARRDRLADPGHELPSVPQGTLALRPQRIHRRLPPPAARPHARDRPLPVRRRPGVDRYRGRVPSRGPRSVSSPIRSARWNEPSGSSRPRLASTRSRRPSRRRSGCRTGRASGLCDTRAKGPRARCSLQPTSTPSSTCIPRSHASRSSVTATA